MAHQHLIDDPSSTGAPARAFPSTPPSNPTQAGQSSTPGLLEDKRGRGGLPDTPRTRVFARHGAQKLPTNRAPSHKRLSDRRPGLGIAISLAEIAGIAKSAGWPTAARNHSGRPAVTNVSATNVLSPAKRAARTASAHASRALPGLETARSLAETAETPFYARHRHPRPEGRQAAAERRARWRAERRPS
jgi:hypothetical protein